LFSISEPFSTWLRAGGSGARCAAPGAAALATLKKVQLSADVGKVFDHAGMRM